MTDDVNPQWSRHLEAIGEELLHLSAACDLDLREPGVVDRIIKDDATVCGRKNEIGFHKLRALVMATYDSLGKSINRIGPAETKKITEAISAHMDQRRQPGGTD